MLSGKEVSLVYETLLSAPGMADMVKIAIQVPRKNILLLTKAVEAGLAVKDEQQTSLLSAVNKDWLNDLSAITEELLTKAGLKEMNEGLRSLQVNK